MSKTFGFKFHWLEPEVACTYPYNEGEPIFTEAQRIAKLSIDQLPSGLTYDDVTKINQETSKIRHGLKSGEDIDHWTLRRTAHPFDVALICDAIQTMEKAILSYSNGSVAIAWIEMSRASHNLGRVIGFKHEDAHSEEFYQNQGSIGGKKAKENRKPFRTKACEEIKAIIFKRHLWNDGHSTESLTKLFWPELETVKRRQKGVWFGIEYSDIIFACIGRRTIKECIDETNPN